MHNKHETDLKPLFWIVPLKHRKISYPQNWMPGLKSDKKKKHLSEQEKPRLFIFSNWRAGSKLTWSTKPNSWATYTLSRSRVLFTDACWPTANNKISPGPAEHRLSSWSLIVGSKLDTRAGIPSRPPIIGNVKTVKGRTKISLHHEIYISFLPPAPQTKGKKKLYVYHHPRPSRKANPLLQIWLLHCKYHLS